MKNYKGLTTEQIINMDWEELNKLNDKELRRITSQLSAVANKRLDNLRKTGIGEYAPAYGSASKRPKRFSGEARYGVRDIPKGKQSVQKVKNELKSVRAFLRTKTGGVEKFGIVRKETAKRLGGEFDSLEQEKDFWSAYRKIMESGKANNIKLDSTQAQQELRRQMLYTNKSLNEILEDKLQELDEEYERSKEEEAQIMGEDDFNELDYVQPKQETYSIQRKNKTIANRRRSRRRR